MMKLSKARMAALATVEHLRDYCLNPPEIVGSVRRGCPEVKDIEILVIPKYEAGPDPNAGLSLFDEVPIVQINRLHEWATSKRCPIQWIKTGVQEIIPWRIEPDGKQWKGLLVTGIKLDLFIANSDNYGAKQLIRTGSADFSRAMMVYASQHTEYQFAGGYLCKGKDRMITPTEETVFEFLGLRYVEPAQRTGPQAIKRIKK